MRKFTRIAILPALMFTTVIHAQGMPKANYDYGVQGGRSGAKTVEATRFNAPSIPPAVAMETLSEAGAPYAKNERMINHAIDMAARGNPTPCAMVQEYRGDPNGALYYSESAKENGLSDLQAQALMAKYTQALCQGN